MKGFLQVEQNLTRSQARAALRMRLRLWCAVAMVVLALPPAFTADGNEVVSIDADEGRAASVYQDLVEQGLRDEGYTASRAQMLFNLYKPHSPRLGASKDEEAGAEETLPAATDNEEADKTDAPESAGAKEAGAEETLPAATKDELKSAKQGALTKVERTKDAALEPADGDSVATLKAKAAKKVELIKKLEEEKASLVAQISGGSEAKAENVRNTDAQNIDKPEKSGAGVESDSTETSADAQKAESTDTPKETPETAEFEAKHPNKVPTH